MSWASVHWHHAATCRSTLLSLVRCPTSLRRVVRGSLRMCCTIATQLMRGFLLRPIVFLRGSFRQSMCLSDDHRRRLRRFSGTAVDAVQQFHRQFLRRLLYVFV